MITSNVIQRTFFIKCGTETGTGFALDINNKQYLITAKHLIKGLDGISTIQIFHEESWKDIQILVVGHCEGDIDISVIKVGYQLTDPDLTLNATSKGMIYGQDAYFLGFPYGLKVKIGEMNRGFPLPFVKKCSISCMGTIKGNIYVIYLDGHNNPGFSGGPVVYKKQNENDFIVTSVISGYMQVNEPIYEGDKSADQFYKYNTGIIVSYGIEHALEIIETNPIGFKLLP